MKDNSTKIVTIGTFDGVHIGHQKILNRVLKLAEINQLEPTVLTLFPHPRMVLEKETNIQLLNTIDERIALLKQQGISTIEVKEFTKKFAELSPEAYVEQILIKDLNTKQIVIGYDHHFGKNRSANINDLKVFAKRFNFTVEEISAQDIEAVTVSSTKIRKALQNGQVTTANTYLGYQYFITGTVIKGRSIGRTIDYPTANINIKESYKLIPKNGVYVVSSTYNGTLIYGMMNIGTNPTVNGTKRSIEVHFFNFNADIYNAKLTLSFLQRLRDEVKFKDIEALKTQLTKDRETALEYIKTLHD